MFRGRPSISFVVAARGARCARPQNDDDRLRENKIFISAMTTFSFHRNLNAN